MQSIDKSINVSIIIPVYNGKDYIDNCMRYIINQSLKNIEVLLVDDGSTDDSLKVLKKYKKYDFVKVIEQKNLGQSVARNKALRMASGEYITYVDIDDYIDTTFIEKMYNCAKENNADLVYCDYFELKDNKKKMIRNIDNLLLTNYAPWGKLYKKSFLRKYSIKFPEGIVFEDIVVTPVLAALTTPVYYPYPLYYYNKSTVTTIRRKTYNKKLKDIYDAMDLLMTNIKKYDLLKTYKDEFEFIYLDTILRKSVFRFAQYGEALKEIPRIRKKVLNYFPDILKNKYYREASLRDKMDYRMALTGNPKLIHWFLRMKTEVKQYEEDFNNRKDDQYRGGRDNPNSVTKQFR